MANFIIDTNLNNQYYPTIINPSFTYKKYVNNYNSIFINYYKSIIGINSEYKSKNIYNINNKDTYNITTIAPNYPIREYY